MTEENGGSEYELRPPVPPSPSESSRPKPGEPGWVPPIPVIQKAESAEEELPVDPDVQQHKAVAILAYILFLIPLIAAPHSKFARFHANQGLLLFIAWWVALILIVVMNFALGVAEGMLGNIQILLLFFSCIFHVVPIAMLFGLLMLTIMGIIHAANGETNRLPVIGNWILIK